MTEVQVVFPENQGLLRPPSSSIERRNLRSCDSAREVNSLHDWLIEQSKVIKETSTSQRTDDTEEWTHHTSREESNASVESRNSLILAENCHDEGMKFEEKGELERAVKYHSKAVDIKRDVLGNEHYSTGISLARLAAVHVKMEKEVEALVLYGEALSVVLEAPIDDELSTTEMFDEEVGHVNHASMVKSHLNVSRNYKHGVVASMQAHIGAIYFRQGRLDEALKRYEKSLACLKVQMVNTSKMPFVGEMYPFLKLDMATLHSIIGKIVHETHGKETDHKCKSLHHLYEAMEIREEFLGTAHLDTLATYNSVGAVYYHHHEYDKAMRYFKRCIVKQIGFGTTQATSMQLPSQASLEEQEKYSYILSKTLSNIGSVYYKTESYAKAMEYYDASLRLLTLERDDDVAKFSEKQLLKAVNYSNIAFVYTKLNDSDKTIFYHNQAAIIRESVLGDHIDTALSYDDVGNICFQISAYPKAFEAYFSSLAIRKKILDDDSPDIAYSYGRVARSALVLGKLDLVINNFNSAIEIEERILSKYHYQLILSYNNLGTAYYDNNEFEKALKCWGKVLAGKLKRFGVHHPQLYSVYSNIGAAYLRKGGEEDAAPWFKKACVVDRERFIREHNIQGSRAANPRPEQTQVILVHKDSTDYDARAYDLFGGEALQETYGTKHDLEEDADDEDIGEDGENVQQDNSERVPLQTIPLDNNPQGIENVQDNYSFKPYKPVRRHSMEFTPRRASMDQGTNMSKWYKSAQEEAPEKPKGGFFSSMFSRFLS
ncbi:hypothetical protein CTEN210_18585 [Chaetoceros tenuissimus]|uniref:Kinesin light chain n=1 Tax=Chaetoceros tenuissimus TaxID=426638 RepID=A0AAD3DCU3_9STRA|nr:hypothetical protein CTEN210_18585 [Chaetoceros tenuissimus]